MQLNRDVLSLVPYYLPRAAELNHYVATTMQKIKPIWLGFLVAMIVGCTNSTDKQATAQACTETWFRVVEDQVSTGDGQGHGPDLGSQEWRSVIEFKLGIRGDSSVPPVESQQWCDYINEHFVKDAK